MRVVALMVRRVEIVHQGEAEEEDKAAVVLVVPWAMLVNGVGSRVINRRICPSTVLAAAAVVVEWSAIMQGFPRNIITGQCTTARATVRRTEVA